MKKRHEKSEQVKTFLTNRFKPVEAIIAVDCKKVCMAVCSCSVGLSLSKPSFFSEQEGRKGFDRLSPNGERYEKVALSPK
jgi:hypothetical protein